MKFNPAELPLDSVVVNDLVEKLKESLQLNDVVLAYNVVNEIEDDKIIMSIWIKLTTPKDNEDLNDHDRWFEKMKFYHLALVQRLLKCFPDLP